MQVDWEWGTVRYKMSNYNPPARPSSASVHPSRRSAAAAQRSSQHLPPAAAVPGTRGDHINNGVTHVNKPSKQISQQVSEQQSISQSIRDFSRG